MKRAESYKLRQKRLLAEQSETLRTSIRHLFAGVLDAPIIVVSKMLDPESESYARQIEAALPVPPEARAFSSAGIFPFQGIRVFAEGQQTLESAQRMRQAFQAANIPFIPGSFQASSCPIHPEIGVFIFVGHK